MLSTRRDSKKWMLTYKIRLKFKFIVLYICANYLVLLARKEDHRTRISAMHCDCNVWHALGAETEGWHLCLSGFLWWTLKRTGYLGIWLYPQLQQLCLLPWVRPWVLTHKLYPTSYSWCMTRVAVPLVVIFWLDGTVFIQVFIGWYGGV